MARPAMICPAASVVLHQPKAASNGGALGRGIAVQCPLLPGPMVLTGATRDRCRLVRSHRRHRQTTPPRLASATPSEITRGPRGIGSGRICTCLERMAVPLSLKPPQTCTASSPGMSRSVTRMGDFRCPIRVAYPQWAGCPRITRFSMATRRRHHSNRIRPRSPISSRLA